MLCIQTLSISKHTCFVQGLCLRVNRHLIIGFLAKRHMLLHSNFLRVDNYWVVFRVTFTSEACLFCRTQLFIYNGNHAGVVRKHCHMMEHGQNAQVCIWQDNWGTKRTSILTEIEITWSYVHQHAMIHINDDKCLKILTPCRLIGGLQTQTN